MLYSGFTYAQEGLKPYDVDYLIQEMLRKVRMEAKAERKPFQETKAFADCINIFGIKNIFNVSAEDREAAAASVKDNVETLVLLDEHFCLSGHQNP